MVARLTLQLRMRGIMLQQETQITSHKTYHGGVPRGTCLIVEDSEFDSIKMTRVLNRSVNSMNQAQKNITRLY